MKSPGSSRRARQGRRPCAEVRLMAEARLGELEQRLTELERFRDELRETVQAWECQGEADGTVCGLIEGLEVGSPSRPPSRRGPDRWAESTGGQKKAAAKESVMPPDAIGEERAHKHEKSARNRVPRERDDV